VFVNVRPAEETLGREKGWRSGSCTTIHSIQGQTVFSPAKLWIVEGNMAFAENLPYTAVSRAESHLQIRRVVLDQYQIAETTQEEKEANISRKLVAYADGDVKYRRVPKDPLTLAAVLAMGNKCFACKKHVYFTGYKPFDDRQFSIDRKDNTKGHGISNCRMSCFGCNRTHADQGLKITLTYVPADNVLKTAKPKNTSARSGDYLAMLYD
jgi:hypothetical protein